MGWQGGRMGRLPAVFMQLLSQVPRAESMEPAFPYALRLGPNSALSCSGQFKEPASASPPLPGIVYCFIEARVSPAQNDMKICFN